MSRGSPRTPRRDLTIQVVKSAGTRYHSLLERADGAQVRLEGGSWNKIGGQPGRVPHDIAHLIVERELGLHAGLWGVLVAGGLVQNAELVGGRRPPHAERRGRELSSRAGEQLRQAEVLVRAAADASLTGSFDKSALQAAAGERWAVDAWTPDAARTIDGQLRDAATAWARLAAGDAYVLLWP